MQAGLTASGESRLPSFRSAVTTCRLCRRYFLLIEDFPGSALYHIFSDCLLFFKPPIHSCRLSHPPSVALYRRKSLSKNKAFPYSALFPYWTVSFFLPFLALSLSPLSFFHSFSVYFPPSSFISLSLSLSHFSIYQTDDLRAQRALNREFRLLMADLQSCPSEFHCARSSFVDEPDLGRTLLTRSRDSRVQQVKCQRGKW